MILNSGLQAASSHPKLCFKYWWLDFIGPWRACGGDSEGLFSVMSLWLNWVSKGPDVFTENLHKPESFLATIYKFICLQSDFVPLYMVHLALGEGHIDSSGGCQQTQQSSSSLLQGQVSAGSPSFGLGPLECCSLSPVPWPFLCLLLGTEEPLCQRTNLRGSDLAAGPELWFSAVLPGFLGICHVSPWQKLFQCQQALTELLPWQGGKNTSVRQLHYITKVIWRHRYSESPLCSFLFPGTISLFSF